MSGDKEVQPLDDENAKILRFMEVFDAEIVESESDIIDVMDVNTDDNGIVQPPF